MATSGSVTLAADSNKVWGAVVRLVNAANYPIIETDQAAKQIIYRASGGGWAWAQNVQVSVTDLGEEECLVTVIAESAGQASLTEGGQQRKLVQFVIEELSKKFPLAAQQSQPVQAPGAGGCLVLLACLAGGIGVLSIVLAAVLQ